MVLTISSSAFLSLLSIFLISPWGTSWVRFIKSLSVSTKKSLTRFLIYIAVILANGNYVNLM